MGYNADNPDKRKEKKKRSRVVVLAIIGIIIVCIAAGVFALYNWQKNNILALRYAKDYSSDEIADRIEDSNKQTQERMSALAGIEMRPLTDEESKLLSDGEITQDEAVLLITGKATLEEIQSGEHPDAEENSADAKTENSAGAESENSTETEDESSESQAVDISSTLAKIYALEGEFTSSVESLISQAKSEVGSMSTADLMRKYSGAVASLEGACDSRLESLLSELDASGCDASVISEIRSAYENKKSLKKAELISRFGN